MAYQDMDLLVDGAAVGGVAVAVAGAAAVDLDLDDDDLLPNVSTGKLLLELFLLSSYIPSMDPGASDSVLAKRFLAYVAGGKIPCHVSQM